MYWVFKVNFVRCFFMLKSKKSPKRAIALHSAGPGALGQALNEGSKCRGSRDMATDPIWSSARAPCCHMALIKKYQG